MSGHLETYKDDPRTGERVKHPRELSEIAKQTERWHLNATLRAGAIAVSFFALLFWLLKLIDG